MKMDNIWIQLDVYVYTYPYIYICSDLFDALPFADVPIFRGILGLWPWHSLCCTEAAHRYQVKVLGGRCKELFFFLQGGGGFV